jgi:K(+)-stimulated pyrophosphate-energized sodium pump
MCVRNIYFLKNGDFKNMISEPPLILAIVCSLLAIAYSLWVLNKILPKNVYSTNIPNVSEITVPIQKGIITYLANRFLMIAVVSVILSILIGLFFHMLTAICFFIGVIISGICNIICINVSIRTSMQFVTKQKNFNTIFQTGTIIGMIGIGLGLLQVSIFCTFATSLIVEDGDFLKCLAGFFIGEALTFILIINWVGKNIYNESINIFFKNFFGLATIKVIGSFVQLAVAISGMYALVICGLIFILNTGQHKLSMSIIRGVLQTDSMIDIKMRMTQYLLVLGAISIITSIIVILCSKAIRNKTINSKTIPIENTMSELRKSLAITGIISLILFYGVTIWLIPQRMLSGGNNVMRLFGACVVGFVLAAILIWMGAYYIKMKLTLTKGTVVLISIAIAIISIIIATSIAYIIAEGYAVSVTLTSTISMIGIFSAYNSFAAIRSQDILFS